MKPIIVTNSNESLIMDADAFESLIKWGVGFFFILGAKYGTVIEPGDIKLIARPKK